MTSEYGVVLHSTQTQPVYEQIDLQRDDELIKVKLESSALNHRDIWIMKGMYAGITLPCVLGSDGAGYAGDRQVVINPGAQWGDQEHVQDRRFHVLGMPTQGTMATAMYCHEDDLFTVPQHLNSQQAAAFSLAGLTAYRATMVKGICSAQKRVLITGIGGGVSVICMQIAKVIGAEVVVTSSSATKRQRALDLGATAALDYRADDYKHTLKEIAGDGFDLIIDSAGGPDFRLLVRYAAFGGRIVLYGGSAGNWEQVNPQMIFWKQLQILGTTMGSPADYAAWWQFVTDHALEPIIDRVYPLRQAAEAFAYLEAGRQMGKVVLDHTV